MLLPVVMGEYLGRRPDAALCSDVACQEIHLVDQDVAVAEDQVFGFVGHVGGVKQLHIGLLRCAAAFLLVTRAAGGNYVHPDVAPALRYRNDVVACQAQAR